MEGEKGVEVVIQQIMSAVVHQCNGGVYLSGLEVPLFPILSITVAIET